MMFTMMLCIYNMVHWLANGTQEIGGHFLVTVAQPSAVCWFPCFLFDFAIILLKTQWISFWDGLRWVLESQLSDIQAMHTTLKFAYTDLDFVQKYPYLQKCVKEEKSAKKQKARWRNFWKDTNTFKDERRTVVQKRHQNTILFFFSEQIPPQRSEKKSFRNNVPTHRCRKCKTSLARTSNSVQSTPSLHFQAENHYVNSDGTTCN